MKHSFFHGLEKTDITTTKTAQSRGHSHSL